MKFPNLLWAIEESRLAHYELASRIGMDASRFSRCLRGRFEFAPHERARIAEVLGYPVEWLFAEARPPRAVASPDPHLAVADV
jgi:hypothetical protein